jgi:hypothetical protein
LMENQELTIPELLTLKYLTESIRPFRTIYKKFDKTFRANELRGMADELLIRFLLIFIRGHSSVWMRFKDEPLSNLFSREEWIAICEHWKNDEYVLSILTLDRWLDRRFKESLTKEEMNLLLTDFEKCLNDARELVISAQLCYTTIRADLKSRAISGEEIIQLLDSNKNCTEPLAYDRSVDFLSKLLSQRKSVGDALVTERNYLERRGLFAHLQRIEEGILGKYFLDTLKTHASKLARAVGERGGEQISWAYEVYYSILGKFKRQPKAHFEHYLNRYLLKERKHELTYRDKFILRDNLDCPFCGYDLKETLKGKMTTCVICPNCKIAIAPWAFKNDLIPKSELPDSFFRDPFESKGPTYRVRTFTPNIGEHDFSDDLDRLVMVDSLLTAKERELIEDIRDANSQGVSMSKVLRRIASEQGKSPHTVTEHYKNALNKLKNLHKKQ